MTLSLRLALAVIPMSQLHGCSVNPVSGKNEFVMMSGAEKQTHAEEKLSLLNDYPSGEPSPVT